MALVSKEDYARLSRYRWYLTSKRYAARYCAGRMIYMHHDVLGSKKEADHRNGQGLDNRRSNLRHVPHYINGHNQQRKPLGVSFDKRRGKWKARIMVKQVERWLGYFVKKEDAIAAVAKARKELMLPWA